MCDKNYFLVQIQMIHMLFKKFKRENWKRFLQKAFLLVEETIKTE